ncbi:MULTISPECIES: ricin-type beta-trefoil lectin domain protein [Streptomyces]|uniref:ricin-type beta-trefoil lectin domain protein n=1 Tax=Streptomyces TaxID=1883 RepID=UPI00135208B3|nr:ricin-type beta-trefoil lectin domain protein [Streptomyces sp. fd1-xmd]
MLLHEPLREVGCSKVHGKKLHRPSRSTLLAFSLRRSETQGGIDLKRSISVTLGALLAFSALSSPPSSAAEQGSVVWTRSDRPEPLAEIGSFYRGTTSSRSLAPSSDKPARPALATPEAREKEILASGSSYQSSITEGNRSSFLKANGSIDFAACNADAKGHEPYGRVVNHFNFCRWGYNTATKLDGQGKIEGQVRFRETEVGQGSADARRARIHVKIDGSVNTGIFGPGKGATVKMAVTSSTTGCGATFGSSTVYQEPVETWNETYVYYEADSPESFGDQNRIDKAASCTVRSSYKVDSPKGATDYSNSIPIDLRFDSAAYLAPYGVKGAVFSRAIPNLTYDYNNKELSRVAEHVFWALNNPDGTDPWISTPKKIPGKIWSDTVLHRNYPSFNAKSEQVAKDNRAAKDAACGNVAKGNPSYECDEFPFASTKEGAGLGDRNFSVRYLPQPDNSKAGGALSKWYGEDRILDGDAFQVLILPGDRLGIGSALSQNALPNKMALDTQSFRSGAAVQLWSYWGGANQDFSINDDNEFRVFGNCVDAGDGTVGTLLTAKACTGGSSQKWAPHPAFKGAIVHVSSGLCMDAKDWGTSNGTSIMLYTCTGNPNQLWVGA